MTTETNNLYLNKYHFLNMNNFMSHTSTCYKRKIIKIASRCGLATLDIPTKTLQKEFLG